MLGRDQHRPLRPGSPKRPRSDAHGLQMRIGHQVMTGQSALSHPAQGLHTVVTRQHHRTRAQVFDGDRSGFGHDLRAGSEADDDDTLDIEEVQRADDGDTVRPVEDKRAVFAVQGVVVDVEPRPAEAGDVDGQAVVVSPAVAAVDQFTKGNIVARRVAA